MPVKGFGVECLETLCLSADLAFRIWKRCACQPMWCSEFGSVAKSADKQNVFRL